MELRVLKIYFDLTPKVVNMKIIDHKIDFVGSCNAGPIVYFFVIILNFILRNFIEIKI